MIESVIVGAGVALVTVVFFAFVPRCPECGSYLSDQSKQSPTLRHCRSCLNTYEVKR